MLDPSKHLSTGKHYLKAKQVNIELFIQVINSEQLL